MWLYLYDCTVFYTLTASVVCKDTKQDYGSKQSTPGSVVPLAMFKYIRWVLLSIFTFLVSRMWVLIGWVKVSDFLTMPACWLTSLPFIYRSCLSCCSVTISVIKAIQRGLPRFVSLGGKSSGRNSQIEISLSLAGPSLVTSSLTIEQPLLLTS